METRVRLVTWPASCFHVGPFRERPGAFAPFCPEPGVLGRALSQTANLLSQTANSGGLPGQRARREDTRMGTVTPMQFRPADAGARHPALIRRHRCGTRQGAQSYRDSLGTGSARHSVSEVAGDSTACRIVLEAKARAESESGGGQRLGLVGFNQQRTSNPNSQGEMSYGQK